MVGRLLLPSHHSIILASLTPLPAEISILKKANWEMKYRIFFVEKEKQWGFQKKCTGGGEGKKTVSRYRHHVYKSI